MIGAKLDNGSLILRISDDGAGMSTEKLEQLRKLLESAVAVPNDSDLDHKEPKEIMNAKDLRDQQGYGVLNVQARIQLTFGERYGMTIESEAGRGTTVTIIHPILKDITG